MTDFPILTSIIFLPLLGGLLTLATGGRPFWCRSLALSVTMMELGMVLSLAFAHLQYQAGPTGAWLLVEDYPWIPSLGVRYSLGLDGISFLLILLTAFINVLCVLISWRSVTTKIGAFHFYLLFLETGVMGLFLATDLLLFYLFWEVQIIPMFFLVGIWGHEKRVQAAVKFALFTFCGSLLMLVALITLYLIHGAQTGVYTFAYAQLMQTHLSAAAQAWIYAAFLLAFAIKIPVIPFHTWLPDTHTHAPTAGSLDLAGLLLKAGFYALFRFGFPLFPEAARGSIPVLIGLGLVGMFYASWVALAQTDMKRLVAYSSIGHMGLMVVGLAVWNMMTLTGSILQMINHGLSTTALFIMVGMLDERIHSRKFEDMGGLWSKIPVFSGFFLFFAMASLGLPGLNNFVGEILVIIGTFQAKPIIGILSFTGLVLAVVYILRMVQDAVCGQPRKNEVIADLCFREGLILAVLALPILFIGLHPGPVLRILDQPVQHLLAQFSVLATGG
ncbi:MAG: complex I subunit 4 family protein [Thermodesulfobacteriota bacterium]